MFSVVDLDRLHRAVCSHTVDGDLTQLLCFCAKALMACAPYYSADTAEAVAAYSSGWQNSGLNILRFTHNRLGKFFVTTKHHFVWVFCRF